jgi:hypothetical protein
MLGRIGLCELLIGVYLRDDSGALMSSIYPTDVPIDGRWVDGRTGRSNVGSIEVRRVKSAE